LVVAVPLICGCEGMGDVWNFRDTHLYRSGFKQPNPLEYMAKWLEGQQFKKDKTSTQTTLKVYKKGIHINFAPELSLLFTQDNSGSHQVALHYYAKIQVGTGIAVGILTSGLSTVVGVGTFATHVMDAKKFVTSLWLALDAIAPEPGVSIHREGFEDKPQQATPPSYQSTPQTTPPTYNSAPPQAPYSPAPSQPPYAPQGAPSQPQYSPQGPPIQSQYAQPPYVPQGTPIQPQYAQPPSTSPAQPGNNDWKSMSVEQLEKQLQYHKETAWKLEREIFERRQQMQYSGAQQGYPPQQYQQYPPGAPPQQFQGGNQQYQGAPAQYPSQGPYSPQAPHTAPQFQGGPQ